jgi:hypothetical protein
MRRIILVLTSVVGLLIPILATAQGTLQLSNLGQTPVGGAATGSDSWNAQGFFTGANPNGYIGYTLNSVELLMDPGLGSPSGFTVSIHDLAVSGNPYDPYLPPGSSLGSLSGPDPSAGGVFTYTASGITLLPSTRYYVVATSATPVANGAYYWSSAASTLTSPWALQYPAFIYSSSNGSDWDFARGITFQLAIYATPVPEPSTLALAGLGLAALSFWRFRQRK